MHQQIMETSQSLDQLNRRSLVAMYGIFALILVVLVNSFRLQVIEGQENLAVSNSIAARSEVVRAPRGLIFARTGERLVSNTASFNLYVSPPEVDLESLKDNFTQVADWFDLDAAVLDQDFQARAYNADGQLVGERITLAQNVPYDLFLRYYRQVEELPGFYINTELVRKYQVGEEYAHILGYLGDITAEELEESEIVDPKARIGKEGLENYYDTRLRGDDGLLVAEDSGANEIDQWLPQGYAAGDNIYLSLEPQWQETLYRSLGRTVEETGAYGGAAVVLNANTGEVMSLVNYPSFSLEAFAEGISTAEFTALIEDERTPLLNRAVAMQIPTGSIFKTYMAAILQEEGAINAETVYDSGCFELPGDYQICEADGADFGRINMTQALARSSNPYFCKATVELARVKGSDVAAIRTLQEYFADFGLGERSPIDLPGSQPGTVPSPELKQRLQGEPWFLADLCNTAIGQGLVSATPLQMASATASLFNGGKLNQPVLAREFEPVDSDPVAVELPQTVSTLDLSENSLREVQRGMAEAVEYGTARNLDSGGIPLWAKTGSSEATIMNANGELESGAHSWLIGTFEYDGDTYSFAVALQFGGRGFRSLPVMQELFQMLNSQ